MTAHIIAWHSGCAWYPSLQGHVPALTVAFPSQRAAESYRGLPYGANAIRCLATREAVLEAFAKLGCDRSLSESLVAERLGDR